MEVSCFFKYRFPQTSSNITASLIGNGSVGVSMGSSICLLVKDMFALDIVKADPAK